MTQLDLYSSQIGSEGSRYLFQALQHSTVVFNLSLAQYFHIDYLADSSSVESD